MSHGRGVEQGTCEICAATGKIIRQATRGQKGTRKLCHVCIRDIMRFNNYGITPQRYREMQIEQNHSCAICGIHETLCKRPGPGGYYGLVVDHCHTTKKVRKLLCHRCNVVVAFGEENLNRLSKAIEYIAQFQYTSRT